MGSGTGSGFLQAPAATTGRRWKPGKYFWTAELVSFGSKEEETKVEARARDCKLHVVGKDWTWSDGTKVGYTNWNATNPQDGPGAEYATMAADGTWGAHKYSYTYTYDEWVCERPAAAPCDDGNSCTKDDSCMTQKCVAGPEACDDNNGCTADSCTAGKTASCTNKPLAGSDCNDGKPCTDMDKCSAVGLCAGTTVTDCDDGNSCTIDSCAEPGGCKHVALGKLVTCGVDKVCLGSSCQAEGKCGSGVVDALAEQCDDGNLQDGDGCSATCTIEPGKSCADLKKMFPALPSGVYDILPATAGSKLKPLQLYCDMLGGGWTLVANIYDSAGDDVPNLPAAVTPGWQKVASGQWKPVEKVLRDKQISAAAGLNFVNAMAAWGAKNVRICMVRADGTDAACRTSPKDLTIGGLPGGSKLLDPVAANAVVWSYGRLSGLPATAATFDTGKLVTGAGCLPKTPGKLFEFGQVCANPDDQGFCESAAGQGWDGVWCANCQGTCFRPARTDGGELGVGAWKGEPEQLDPLDETWGFRIYLGP